MVQRVSTVAFEGIEARSVDVQVQVAPGLPAFSSCIVNGKDEGRTLVDRVPLRFQHVFSSMGIGGRGALSQRQLTTQRRQPVVTTASFIK